MMILGLVFQTAIAFFAILIFTRILGKEQLSQLTYFDYINGITIGSIAGTIATDDANKISVHLLDLIIFCLLTYLISLLVLKNRPLRKLLDGEPTVVIHNGKILEKNMNHIRYNMDDLLMQLRQKNIFNTDDVEFGIVEHNGELSVLLKSQKRSLTPNDLNISTKYEGLEGNLIMDGEIIHKNLAQFNLDENWLKTELINKGINDLRTVAYAALDSNGKLYVDIKFDDIKGRPIG